MPTVDRPAELVLARGLMASLPTPALLLDAGGELVFYNDAAGALLALRFEQAAAMSPAEWSARFSFTDGGGRSLQRSELPLTLALERERPAHRRMWIDAGTRGWREIEASAFPIAGPAGVCGAMAVFWETTRPGGNAQSAARAASR